MTVARITHAFIAAHVVVFVLVGGALFAPLNLLVVEDMSDHWSLSRETFTDHPWTLITSSFMHAGALHIFLNMLVLGFLVNQISGRFFLGSERVPLKRVSLVYGVSILTSSIAVLLWPHSSGLPTVGASGTIFGLAGFMITYSSMKCTRRQMIKFAVINMSISFLIPMISWQAHLGGLVGGMAMGILLTRLGQRSPSSFTRPVQLDSSPST